MRSCTETNPYICISEEMCCIPQRFDIDIDNQYRQFNPYMPNPLIFISPNDAEYEKLDYFFKLNFEIPSPVRRPSWKRPAEPLKPVAEKTSLDIERNADTQPSGPLCLSWNHLGRPQSKVPRERPFVSECPEAMYHLTNLLNLNHGHSLKVVEEPHYLMTLKYLATGVESDFFVYDEVNVSFAERENGITVGNFSPEAVQEVNRKFIEFGTCFKRLETATSVNAVALTLPVEGFVYKSLSQAINKFLFSIRHFIFNGSKSETMLQFSMRIRPFAKVIGFFAKVFKVHPQSECSPGGFLRAINSYSSCLYFR